MAGEVTLPEVDVQGAAPAAPAAAPLSIGGKVPMVNPDTSIGMVAPEDVEAGKAEGLRPATLAEFDRADMGTAGKVGSALIGAGRGLTFGASDPLLIEGSRVLGGNASAEDTRQALNRAKNANKTESFGGEIAGSLAGMVLVPGGGASAVAREGMLARAAARFAQVAPRAALEGGLMGVGSQMSEDALGGHAASAEKYISSFAGGFVFGGILGGGLHAVGGAVADKARTFYGGPASGAIATQASAAAGTAPAGQQSGVMAWLRNAANGEAEQQAFKATGAKIKDIQRLGATAEAQAERTGRIGRTLLDEGIVTPLAGKETIAERLTAKVRQVGEDLSAMRKTLDTAVERPAMSNIAARFDAEVVQPLAKLPLGESEGRPAQAYLADMIAKGGDRPDFATLFKYRRHLDTLLEKGGEYSKVMGGPSKAGAESLRALRGIVEDEFESAGERAAKEIGNDAFADKYRLAKQLFGDLRTAEKITAKEAARGNANRAISLTDTIAAGTAFAGGSQHDDTTGAALGLAAMLGNKAMRTHGNQIAATLLNKASRLQMLQAANTAANTAITNGVKGFLGGKAASTTAAPAAAATPPKVTQATVTAIREATRDPQALTARITAMFSGRGLGEAAPNVAQSVATTSMRIASYLRDKAPKDPAPTGVAFARPRPRPGSATEAAKFARAVEVANDPMIVVRDLENGRLNREKVEALEACYPLLYEQIRAELTAQGVKDRPDLSQQQEIALSVLFKQPVSAIMQPKTIRSIQQIFAQGADPSQTAQAGQPTPPTKPVRGLQRRGTMASGFDTQEAPRGK